MEEDITLILRDGMPLAGGDAGSSAGVGAPDGFALERILGRGGMGAVYLARRTDDGRQVALKILYPDVAKLENVIERFQREARLMMQFEHPNIVKAYDVGMRGDCYYMSMEYVPGRTLAAVIRREERLGDVDALRVMRQVADAVDYGTHQGIVHRDLKPDNVIIRDDGVAKLTDLGLAVHVQREDLRLTAAGTTLGTPLYMSPEQAEGRRDIDARADVYSFGCMFYHALCGRPPFQGEDGLEVLRSHIRREAPAPREIVPEIREDVEAVLLKCMAKDRGKRYQTGGEIVQTIDLIMFAVGEDPAPAPLVRSKVPPSSRRFADGVHFSFDDSSPGGPKPA